MIWAGIGAVVIVMIGTDLLGFGLGTATHIYLKRRAKRADEASKADD
jgi:hypothetical protein